MCTVEMMATYSRAEICEVPHSSWSEPAGARVMRKLPFVNLDRVIGSAITSEIL